MVESTDQKTGDTRMWALPENERSKTALWRFADATRPLHGLEPDNYPGLHAWSVNQPEAFHAALWDFLDIIGDRGERTVVPGTDITRTRLFPDARLNYAENLLRNADDRPAIISLRDDATCRTLTRRELYRQVSRWVQAFRAAGLRPGDRVAAIVTNEPETIAAYLACAAMGAIWASCSPDFGPVSAADRLAQIAPAILVAVQSYRYGDKHCDVRPTIRAVADACDRQEGLKKIVLLNETPESLGADYPAVTLADFLFPHEAAEIAFEQLPFTAPLCILFSSGTTGKPKCIVHSAMGLLLQHKKEHMLHCDMRSTDRFFYFTTCGWMMWNWQVSALALETTLVIYDGNPHYPDKDHLIGLVEQEHISVFGTSARYLASCEQLGLRPAESHDLSSLRQILSTGSPLLPDSFDYVYTHWKPTVHLASISGGTDICACFLGGNPLLPVYRGELQCAMLGMDVTVYDDNANELDDIPGELVCRNAHLSMPLGFWNDSDGSRYRQAYFNRFPGVWTHGDFVSRSPTGGFVIHGRSDTTLNPGGVRIGTAEIYRQLERMDLVQDGVVVGWNTQGDQQVLLFVVLQDGLELDAALTDRIRQQIRSGASPRHVPAHIFQVPDVPRTRSGKLSEVAVRQIIHGQALTNREALANPGCLESFAKAVEETVDTRPSMTRR